jgi:hypothetical protein
MNVSKTGTDVKCFVTETATETAPIIVPLRETRNAEINVAMIRRQSRDFQNALIG